MLILSTFTKSMLLFIHREAEQKGISRHSPIEYQHILSGNKKNLAKEKASIKSMNFINFRPGDYSIINDLDSIGGDIQNYFRIIMAKTVTE